MLESGMGGKSLKHAIEEVLVILAKRHHIKFSDPSSLFDWAKKGFKTKLPTSYVKSNSSELPSIVLNALKSSKFLRKCESESEEEDKSEISDTLADVSKGCISLEVRSSHFLPLRERLHFLIKLLCVPSFARFCVAHQDKVALDGHVHFPSLLSRNMSTTQGFYYAQVF
ncbi:DNA-methyltransferase 3B [Trichonephila inaurata madagascariensis]|uniref:DNA-methyltransferase 3B n=1 Tax=Trichonephila inaurata madagascariensis TaxID=2747483 RepID=A0A8X7C9B6_9ARAC|nr:DNA-methyltransferase 3B [Trichonephila inaurata madagascariensis]